MCNDSQRHSQSYSNKPSVVCLLTPRGKLTHVPTLPLPSHTCQLFYKYNTCMSKRRIPLAFLRISGHLSFSQPCFFLFPISASYYGFLLSISMIPAKTYTLLSGIYSTNILDSSNPVSAIMYRAALCLISLRLPSVSSVK